jgi:hypothetical protein
MNDVTVPKSIGPNSLAYITNSEKKLLKRREAMKGFPSKKDVSGVPVLADSRAAIIAHAKGLGISNVPTAGVSKGDWKRFTQRLNATKARQRTGPSEGGGLKKFVLTDAQKKRSSAFYSKPSGAAYAKQLGKKKGFGIRAPKKEVKTPTKTTKTDDDDGSKTPSVTRPGPDPTTITPVEEMSVTIDTSQLEKPLLEEIVVLGEKSEVIQERLKNLINTNSPLFKAATTKALQSMNASGLVNSSIAQEAVMSAILAVAVPIAQADAQAFLAQRMANQNASNAFKAAQNAAYYEAFMTKLTGQINQTLRQLAERSANWRAILSERGRIAITPRMSKSAAENAMKAVTPAWF